MALSVLTYNIRTLTPIDGVNQWMYRRDALAAMLNRQRPDVMGLQEVQRPQLDDLIARLPDYTWYGVGRDDGKDAGEFTPLFWRTERFERRDAGSFWLAGDCGKPGFGWDAVCVRIASWVVLRDRTDGREILFVNTHLDHRGRTAQLEGAQLVASRLQSLAAGRPAVLSGDFNCTPDREPYAAVLASGLRDARTIAAERSGPLETCTDWRGSGFRPILIDFLFVSSQWTVTRHEVLPEDGDGRQLSDHRAVMAVLK